MSRMHVRGQRQQMCALRESSQATLDINLYLRVALAAHGGVSSGRMRAAHRSRTSDRCANDHTSLRRAANRRETLAHIERRMSRGLLNAESPSAHSTAFTGKSAIAAHEFDQGARPLHDRRHRHIGETIAFAMRETRQRIAEVMINTPVPFGSRSSAWRAVTARTVLRTACEKSAITLLERA